MTLHDPPLVKPPYHTPTLYPPLLVTPSPSTPSPSAPTPRPTDFKGYHPSALLTWSWALPQPMFPLWEVAGVGGTVQVHVPFSMSDMSQIEAHLHFF
jgi:hypothetical protein